LAASVGKAAADIAASREMHIALASLGSLISDGARDMETAPWLLLAPAGCLTALTLSLNVLGDGLRDVLDPRTRP
jgi:oligopeptide transport system permease protein